MIGGILALNKMTTNAFLLSVCLLLLLVSTRTGSSFRSNPTVSSSFTVPARRRMGADLRSAVVDVGDAFNNATLPSSSSSSSSSSPSPSSRGSSSSSWLAARVRSVNYFISRKCNYACRFCFHTQKTTDALSIDDAIRGLEMLHRAGTQKINFAGGEPFLRPYLLGRLCQRAHELGMAVSIISNGSMITHEWMKQFGYYVDVLGLSVDSFSATTNAKIGRRDHYDPNRDGDLHHVTRILKVREWCEEYRIKFKVNTVVCRLNWEEDMTERMTELDPVRWKVFQVLILEGENAGNGDLRDARALTISDAQYRAFVDRHASDFPRLIPESNDVMRNSYLLLDERLRFLDCSEGGKVPSESILGVGVERALAQAGFDYEMFRQRGGIFEWTRDRSGDGREPE